MGGGDWRTAGAAGAATAGGPGRASAPDPAGRHFNLPRARRTFSGVMGRSWQR